MRGKMKAWRSICSDMYRGGRITRGRCDKMRISYQKVFWRDGPFCHFVKWPLVPKRVERALSIIIHIRRNISRIPGNHPRTSNHLKAQINISSNTPDKKMRGRTITNIPWYIWLLALWSLLWWNSPIVCSNTTAIIKWIWSKLSVGFFANSRTKSSRAVANLAATNWVAFLVLTKRAPQALAAPISTTGFPLCCQVGAWMMGTWVWNALRNR